MLLGFDRLEDYRREAAAGGGAYLGATCGRVANRIAGAAYRLDGRSHPLAANEGANQRHGGPDGFDRAWWDVVEAGPARVVMRHHSPDGDQGHPGALDVAASFALSDRELTIVYTATTRTSGGPTHTPRPRRPRFTAKKCAECPSSRSTQACS